MKEFIQRVGGAASGMVIPNIGAFIAWGLMQLLSEQTVHNSWVLC